MVGVVIAGLQKLDEGEAAREGGRGVLALGTGAGRKRH